MTKPTTTEPPLPLPNQTTIDAMPVPPACKTADFDKANILRRRIIKQLATLPKGLALWVVQCAAKELEETVL